MQLLPIAALTLFVILCPSIEGQSSPDTRTLSIAGQPGSVRVREYSGKSYIALDDLARLTHGSLSFTGNQIVLALPAALAVPQPAPVRTGFSKPFLEAGIEQMSTIREWRITIVNSIQNNSPVPEEWISRLRRKADEQLTLAATARNTDDDRSGYPLLAAEFANMQKFSERFLARRKQLEYIDPKSTDNDPLDRQILACARGLASMAAENQFHEEAACTELQ